MAIGSMQSLASNRTQICHPEQEATKVTPGLVGLSVGIENLADILAYLELGFVPIAVLGMAASGGPLPPVGHERRAIRSVNGVSSSSDPKTSESGFVIPQLKVAYQSWGQLNPVRSNAVSICHALTGDFDVVGPQGNGHLQPGWWQSLVGPG